MARLIAQFVDNGIMLVAAAVLLRYYFKPEATRLYKRKWIPFACAFMILYSLFEIGLAYREHLQNRLPSRKELEERILANNTVAGADFQYRSPHGYTIKVPKGYAYTEFASGTFSLTAIKDTIGLVVLRQHCPEPLNKIVPETCQYLKQKNPTYAFTDQQSITIGGTPAIRINVAVTKETGPIKGFALFFKKGSDLFQVLLTCSATDFLNNKSQLESIIDSLTL
jgi:hypothetical protein